MRILAFFIIFLLTILLIHANIFQSNALGIGLDNGGKTMLWDSAGPIEVISEMLAPVIGAMFGAGIAVYHGIAPVVGMVVEGIVGLGRLVGLLLIGSLA